MDVENLPIPLLNFWVARAFNLPVVFEGGDVRWTGEVPAEFAQAVGWFDLPPRAHPPLNFAEDPALGHNVIEWVGISIERPFHSQKPRIWRAVTDWRGPTKPHRFNSPESGTGKTALIAAMRALVCATFGSTVPELP